MDRVKMGFSCICTLSVFLQEIPELTDHSSLDEGRLELRRRVPKTKEG